MATLFQARMTTANDAARAFGLVCLFYPHIKPSRWRSHLDRLAKGSADRGGCVIIEDARGCIHAACLYRRVRDPFEGWRLDVSHVVHASLPASPALGLLIGFLEGLAIRLQCGAIVLSQAARPVDADDDGLISTLARDIMAFGYKPSAANLTKPVGNA